MAESPTGARVTKRTISDAIQSLDAACRDSSRPSSSVSRLHPKKRRTSGPPTSTPALEAILARSHPARSTVSPAEPPASYDPTSLAALLARLATFKLTTYSPSKPPSLSALVCARHGWTNHGARERLECVTCRKGVVLLAPTARGGWTGPAGLALQLEYERQLVAPGLAHDSTCPWRMRPCSKGLYRLEGGPRRRLLEVVARQALEMHERDLGEIQLDLPVSARHLLEEPGAHEKLLKSVASCSPRPPPSDPTATTDQWQNEPSPSLTSTTILLAIFGWSLDPLPLPPTSSLARSTSSSSLASTAATPILSCSYCLRQIFTTPYLASSSDAPRKPLNPCSQHYSYCPYIDTTTTTYLNPTPTPPPPSSTSSSSTPTAASLPAGVPAKKPGYQLRLESVLQKQPAVSTWHGSGSTAFARLGGSGGQPEAQQAAVAVEADRAAGPGLGAKPKSNAVKVNAIPAPYPFRLSVDSSILARQRY
ncbi:hypothetical protein JCM11491_001380 [Sporobolomyces phaffii]